MNFLTTWERIWIKRFISLCQFRVSKFLICLSISKGVWLIFSHICGNGILLMSFLFDESEEPQVGLRLGVVLPNDAKLICGFLGSPLVVLSIVLLVGLLKSKTFLLDSFVVGLQLFSVMFPVLFATVSVRTYTSTKELFRCPNLTHQNATFVSSREKYISHVLFCCLVYALASYLVHLYYIIVVLSFKDGLEQFISKRKEKEYCVTVSELKQETL